MPQDNFKSFPIFTATHDCYRRELFFFSLRNWWSSKLQPIPSSHVAAKAIKNPHRLYTVPYYKEQHISSVSCICFTLSFFHLSNGGGSCRSKQLVAVRCPKSVVVVCGETDLLLPSAMATSNSSRLFPTTIHIS